MTSLKSMSDEKTLLVNNCDVNNRTQLDTFLMQVERRALRMSQIATGNRDHALDIVQDSMMKLVQSYANHEPKQWRPLFFRILHNRTMDWHRQQHRNAKLFESWFVKDSTKSESIDITEHTAGSPDSEPEQRAIDDASMLKLESAIQQLSPRQQQAFFLRCWEGLSTAETATTMACSEGTVKTLYSRALATLRQRLGEYDG